MRLSKSTAVSLEGDRICSAAKPLPDCLCRAKTDYTHAPTACQAFERLISSVSPRDHVIGLFRLPENRDTAEQRGRPGQRSPAVAEPTARSAGRLRWRSARRASAWTRRAPPDQQVRPRRARRRLRAASAAGGGSPRNACAQLRLGRAPATSPLKSAALIASASRSARLAVHEAGHLAREHPLGLALLRRRPVVCRSAPRSRSSVRNVK